MPFLRRVGIWMGLQMKEVLAGLAVSSWLLGIALPVHAAPSTQVGVSVYILAPPNAITDLVASPVGSQDGDVQLTWTAPGNDNGVPVVSYNVRTATYAAPSVGQAETWWTQAAATDQVVTPAHSSGTVEFVSLHNLSVGVTYYFAIKSTDRDNQVSALDTRTGTINQAHCQPVSSGPPSAPSGFTGIALSTGSVSWMWTASANADYYTLHAYPSGNLINQTNGTSLVETGQTPNSALSRTVRAVNGLGASPSSAVVTVYTFAAVPTSPVFTNVQFSNITLSWNASGNASGTQYRLERSDDGSNYAAVTLTTANSYQDSGLTENTTYFYRIRAINGDGQMTSPSVVISTATHLRTDNIPPMPPMGLKGILDNTGRVFTLSWESPIVNEDSTPFTDLSGYNVYRRTTLTGTPSKLTPIPITSTAFADQNNNLTYFYTVRALDTSGNESQDSLFADSSSQTNTIFTSSDSVSSVVMPSTVNNLLRSQYNKYGVPLTISMVEEPVPTNTSVLRQVKINLLRGDTFATVNDLAFLFPETTVNVGYNIRDGQIVPGAPIQSLITPAQANRLSLYWNNGVTWVKVGGTVDPAAQTVHIRSSYLGTYQLRVMGEPTNALALEQANVFPRLFTPNGDGFNDQVFFVLENPNNVNVTGKITDSSGRFVANLRAASGGVGIGTTLLWDGKDAQGSVVPSGVYFYRIEGESKSFTGSVGVAR